MRKVQALFSVALVVLFGSVANAAIPATGVVGDGIISLVYDPADGSLELDIAGKEMTALEIGSAGKYFTGAQPSQVGGPGAFFDVFKPEKMFTLKPGNARFTTNQDFGTPLAKGLSKEAIAADLTVSGALFPQGGLGTVDLVYVPEPSSIALFGLGLLGLVRRRK